MSNLLKKEKGFTLIEIVLVLAIAGLLLVIVFLALSGAQKSRRDSQRKNDASALVTAVENYASNNGGTLPSAAQITATYFSRNDPNGTAYTINAKVDGTNKLAFLGYATNTICSGQVGTGTGATANNYAVVVALEQGGSACYDNH